MQSLLFAVPLKAGKLSDYKRFAKEITGPRKKEYADLLNRYGLLTTKVWVHRFEEKEYVLIQHDAEDDALELMENWSSSSHPFDIWFREQFSNCYEGSFEPTQLLFHFDAHIFSL